MRTLHRADVAFALAAVLLVHGAVASLTAQHGNMPAGLTHEEHMAQMKQHGDVAMGFDQDKATHHFSLTARGGTIAVDGSDPSDAATRDQIRTHLREIAQSFKQGDFGKPLMTHGEMPPGVATMQRLKAAINYVFESTAHGGSVRISTTNPDALKAVHEFLLYQITEHKTGDPLTVQK
jgi:hypothetical protein